MPPIAVIDAFTTTPFTGNPAAVVLLDRERDAEWMQRVASEMNLSETAFLCAASPGHFSLRWFTPKEEVQLCGHATLASAFYLWNVAGVPKQELQFSTKSGILRAWPSADGGVALDFPRLEPEFVGRVPGVEKALGTPVMLMARCGKYSLAELASEEAVRSARPDITALAATTAPNLAITARASTPGVDFVSRFFAPLLGIPEDPVTGSTHCLLAPYWHGRLDGKSEFIAHQLSARGGKLRVILQDSRVRLEGQATLVWRGDLLA